jgi:hypothetical protein
MATDPSFESLSDTIISYVRCLGAVFITEAIVSLRYFSTLYETMIIDISNIAYRKQRIAYSS